MSTRYEQLRSVIATLAASASEQTAFLDKLHEPLTGGGSAAAYGNDEIALELEDSFIAADDMVSFGELTASEVEAIRPLHDLLGQLSGKHESAFWQRDALYNDPRWTAVRTLAQEILKQLPDEVRAFGRYFPDGG